MRISCVLDVAFVVDCVLAVLAVAAVVDCVAVGVGVGVAAVAADAARVLLSDHQTSV